MVLFKIVAFKADFFQFILLWVLLSIVFISIDHDIFDENMFMWIELIFLRILAITMLFSYNNSTNHCRLNCFFVTLIKCVNLNLAETL